MKFLFFAFALYTLVGCGGTYSNTDKSDFDKKIRTYIQKKGLKMEKLPSGLYLHEVQKGTGKEKAQFTSQVKLVYKGKLLNGRVFDNTDPSKPFDSKVNGLIAGFQEAILNRTSGTKLKLIVPPHLGYGDDELDKIPANSVLVFDLEIVEVY